MKAKEVIRWGLLILSAGITVRIVFWGGSRMIPFLLDQRWADASGMLFQTVLFAAFPVMYAIAAFQRRWRDLFEAPVILGGLALWCILMISPATLGLHELPNTLVSLNERYPWLLLVEVVLVPVILLKVLLTVIEWLAKTAIRLLARYRASNDS